MAGIARVGHVVLYFEDLEKATAFYRDKLGMEVVRGDAERVFMSFGDYHHNIALFQAHGEMTRGSLGLCHIGLVCSGGMAELKEIHDRMVANGVEIRGLTDHGFIRSFQFLDPEGNHLEIYCERMGALEGKKSLLENPGFMHSFDWETVLAPAQT